VLGTLPFSKLIFFHLFLQCPSSFVFCLVDMSYMLSFFFFIPFTPSLPPLICDSFSRNLSSCPRFLYFSEILDSIFLLPQIIDSLYPASDKLSKYVVILLFYQSLLSLFVVLMTCCTPLPSPLVPEVCFPFSAPGQILVQLGVLFLSHSSFYGPFFHCLRKLLYPTITLD